MINQPHTILFADSLELQSIAIALSLQRIGLEGYEGKVIMIVFLGELSVFLIYLSYSKPSAG